MGLAEDRAGLTAARDVFGEALGMAIALSQKLQEAQGMVMGVAVGIDNQELTEVTGNGAVAEVDANDAAEHINAAISGLQDYIGRMS